MLHCTVIAVGKLGERHWSAACDEYRKRLGGFCKAAVVEVAEQRLPQNPSEAEIAKCVEAEGAAILAKIPPRAHVIALCIEGRQLASQALAAEFDRLAAETSHVVFVIGGSHGLAEAVKAAAHRRMSMSEMTFPHQLARVMLLEQIYRGFSIAHGGKYHK